MMDLLPEAMLNKLYREKHNLKYIDSMNHYKTTRYTNYDDVQTTLW